jgi:hypothetical protein
MKIELSRKNHYFSITVNNGSRPLPSDKEAIYLSFTSVSQVVHGAQNPTAGRGQFAAKIAGASNRLDEAPPANEQEA